MISVVLANRPDRSAHAFWVDLSAYERSERSIVRLMLRDRRGLGVTSLCGRGFEELPPRRDPILRKPRICDACAVVISQIANLTYAVTTLENALEVVLLWCQSPQTFASETPAFMATALRDALRDSRGRQSWGLLKAEWPQRAIEEG